MNEPIGFISSEELILRARRAMAEQRTRLIERVRFIDRVKLEALPTENLRAALRALREVTE